MSLFFSLVLCLLSTLVTAQTSQLFQWQFANNFLSTSLPTCSNLSINVGLFNPANDTSALFHAPFYMIAFEVGGTPRTTLLGVDNAHLNWVVDHPVGTKLMLSVVDANGSAGGVPPNLFKVVAGQTTSCVQTSTSSDFTVKANVTDTLTTCQPWRLSITGGVPPYNVTLAALNSPNITNVTIEGIDDAFTYIDRANPGTQLLAGISDLTGRWASGTPIVSTQGSADVTCVGLVSTSGNATQLQQQDEAAAAAAISAKHKRTAIIAGVCVTFGTLLLLGVGLFVYLRRRKARLAAPANRSLLDLSVSPFQDMSARSEGQVLSINSWVTDSETPRSTKFGGTMQSQPSSDQSVLGESSTSQPASSFSRPGFVAFPVRRKKTAEANLQQAVPSDPNRKGAGRDEESEIVIQHQDAGGAIVRELPPPYADRTVREG